MQRRNNSLKENTHKLNYNSSSLPFRSQNAQVYILLTGGHQKCYNRNETSLRYTCLVSWLPRHHHHHHPHPLSSLKWVKPASQQRQLHRLCVNPARALVYFLFSTTTIHIFEFESLHSPCSASSCYVPLSSMLLSLLLYFDSASRHKSYPARFLSLLLLGTFPFRSIYW